MQTIMIVDCKYYTTSDMHDDEKWPKNRRLYVLPVGYIDVAFSQDDDDYVLSTKI